MRTDLFIFNPRVTGHFLDLTENPRAIGSVMNEGEAARLCRLFKLYKCIIHGIIVK